MPIANDLMRGFPVARGNRIPRQEWDRPPWNRWSFQHIREILPTTEVWRGRGPVWKLPCGSRDLDEIEFDDVEDRSTNVAAWLRSSCTDGLAVLYRGRLVHERYFNSMTERTLHLSQSMAKSITSAVAGVLVDRGLLDPDEQIVSYLPELKRTAWRGATLRHSLDMTSGVRYVEDYESPDSDIAVTDIASGWRMPRRGVKTHACMWDQIVTLKTKVREHGERFEYRSIETDVLAHCMERVTQTRLAELVSRELWQPLGCEESACFTVDAAGYAMADGGFNATLRDYARFGQMLLDQGIGNGRRVVPSEWLDDTLDCNPAIFGEPHNDGFPNGAYRNQFWIRDASRRVIMARGVFGQLIYVDLDNDLVVVKLSSWPEFLSTERKKDDIGAIDAICEHLKEGRDA